MVGAVEPKSDTRRLFYEAGAACASESSSEMIGIVKKFRLGETLVAEDQVSRHCYRVICGAVKEYFTMEDGQRQISGFFGPGEIVALDADSERHAAVEAISDCVVQAFPRTVLTIGNRPDAPMSMVELLTRRLETAYSQLGMIARKCASERIATFLLHIAENEGRREGLRLVMNRQDMADHLGLTIETVCRVLTDLKRNRVIAMPSARVFTILDELRLRTAAGADFRS